MHFRYVRLCVKRFWCANRCCFPMTKWSMGSCIWLCWCCCCCHRQWCEMTFNKRHKCGCVCVVSVWLCACGVLIELWWLLPQLLSTLQRTGIRVCVCLCCTPCIVYTRRLCVSPDSFLYFDWLHVLCVCMGVQVVFDCVLHECLSWLCKCHRDIESVNARKSIQCFQCLHFVWCVRECVVFHCLCLCREWKNVWVSLHFILISCTFWMQFYRVTPKNVPNRHYLITTNYKEQGKICEAATAAAAANAVTKSNRCINTFNDSCWNSCCDF